MLTLINPAAAVDQRMPSSQQAAMRAAVAEGTRFQPPGLSSAPSPTASSAAQRAPVPPPSAEALRNCAWNIGAAKAAAGYLPAANHVGLAYAAPRQALAHWRILQSWIDRTAQQRGGAWHNCRMVLRLYDVTCLQFNGFNAHHVLDVPLSQICGQQLIALPRPGTTQLAETGFVLRSGEFIPAARSEFVQFPPGAVSRAAATPRSSLTGNCARRRSPPDGSKPRT